MLFSGPKASAAGVPVTPDESGGRGQDPEHESLDYQPRQSQPALPTPEGRENLPGATEREKGAGRAFLPAPFRSRLDRRISSWEGAHDQAQRVLLVRLRREAVTPSPLCQVPCLGHPD